MFLRWLSICLIALFIAGCGSSARAPVGERSPYERPNPGVHTVRSGESLYSIAWQYDLDYRTVARWNGIKPPYTIYAGQKIRVKPVSRSVGAPVRESAAAAKSPSSRSPEKTAEKQKPQSTPARTSSHPQLSQTGEVAFIWPYKGPLIKAFNSSEEGKTGIAIGGSRGAKIQASAAGKVVYAGSGLVGYGRLIIVKHNKIFLSAYGHNDRILVKEGDWVQRGQVIATMGSTGTNQTKLHFEIRRYGKPVNPMRYLPR